VQQSLIEHESMLDISSQLTRINCEVDAMRDVDIGRRPPDLDGLNKMMADQSMDSARTQKWQSYLDAGSFLEVR